MRVLVYEDNLMWSSRFRISLKGLGHEAVLLGSPTVPDADSPAPVAIVNLGSQKLNAAVLVPELVSRGVHVIGHAGHKEMELLELGHAAGCQTVATNSQITYKLEELLRVATGE